VRHDSFLVPEFIRLLRDFEIAAVFSEHESYPAIADVTADFLYLRLQKADDTIETGYQLSAIADWAKRIETWLAGGAPTDLRPIAGAKSKHKPQEIFVYFIHEGKVRAPAAAMALIEKLRP
jgi:uncharacterized protein YecE (DUF72 family)